jgi:hypothetical protein
MEYITISKKWNNPQITIEITDDGISLSMSMEDFKEALLQEMRTSRVVSVDDLKAKVKSGVGSVTMVFRDKTFTDKLYSAIDGATGVYGEAEFKQRLITGIGRVVEGIKLESVKVADKIKPGEVKK